MELEMFYLTNCPYCHNASRAIDDLVKENPAYATVSIHRIEESQEPDLVAKRNYYYVPTFYLGDDKLYEAQPGQSYEEIRENVQRVLDAGLSKS